MKSRFLHPKHWKLLMFVYIYILATEQYDFLRGPIKLGVTNELKTRGQEGRRSFALDTVVCGGGGRARPQELMVLSSDANTR